MGKKAEKFVFFIFFFNNDCLHKIFGCVSRGGWISLYMYLYKYSNKTVDKCQHSFCNSSVLALYLVVEFNWLLIEHKERALGKFKITRYNCIHCHFHKAMRENSVLDCARPQSIGDGFL